MFIRPNSAELEQFEPDFTIINASDIQNEDFQQHGLNSKTFVLFHIGRRIAIIGGTEYGGEMKKRYFFSIALSASPARSPFYALFC